MNEILEGMLAVGAMGAQVLDYVLTVTALGKGFKEVGLINSKVVAKWGVNALAPATFIEAAAFLVVFGVFASMSDAAGAAFAGSFFAAEAVNDIISLVKLKKAKVI